MTGSAAIRLWERSDAPGVWGWQVIAPGAVVLASGSEPGRSAARRPAIRACARAGLYPVLDPGDYRAQP